MFGRDRLHFGLRARCVVTVSLVAMWAATAVAQEPAAPEPPSLTPSDAFENPAAGRTRFNLPEAPATVVEGTMQGVGSQGQAVSGGTPLISPNLTPTTLADSGSSVSVITAEQIAQRGQTNVAELLRTLPGLDVVRNGPPGSPTTVFLRGANGSMTKVLIDGIPQNDPSSPSRAFDFSNLSVDNIERIEIIRGPQSVLFGSDAIGGVINIITRKGKGPISSRFAALGGSYNTSNEAFNVSGSKGPTYYSFGGSLFNTSGFSAASSGVETDAYTLGTFSSRTGWQPSENVNLDVVVRANQSRSDIDNAFGTPSDNLIDSTTFQSLSTGLRLHTRGEAGIYEQLTAYYVTDINRGFRSPSFDFFEVYHGNIQQIDSRHTLHLIDTSLLGNDVTVGGLYYTETYKSEDNFGGGFPNTSIDDGAFYAQDQIRVGQAWFTTVGGRRDHYNPYGDADTYRITSLYRSPGTKTAIRGSIGTGFRVPSLVETFTTPPFGNPNLQPEKSEGWDVGVEQPMFDGDFVPSVTYFHNDFTNFIQSDAFFTPQNLQKARSQGVELSGLFVLSPERTLTANYTFMDAIDLTPGSLTFNQQLIRRPRNKVGVVYNRSFHCGRGNWNLSGYYADLRNDQVSGRIVQLHSYIVVNTAASYNLTKNFQIFGRIDNLLGAQYSEVFGFNVPGFSGYGGAAMFW